MQNPFYFHRYHTYAISNMLMRCDYRPSFKDLGSPRMRSIVRKLVHLVAAPHTRVRIRTWMCMMCIVFAGLQLHVDVGHFCIRDTGKLDCGVDLCACHIVAVDVQDRLGMIGIPKDHCGTCAEFLMVDVPEEYAMTLNTSCFTSYPSAAQSCDELYIVQDKVPWVAQI